MSKTKSEFDEKRKKGLIITFFSKSKNLDHRYLSNFCVIDGGLSIDGKRFASIEHFFQFSKYKYAKAQRDNSKIPDFSSCSSLKAKSLGSKSAMTKNGYELDVVGWNKARVEVMTRAIVCRLKQDKKFKQIIYDLRGKKGCLLVHFERGRSPFWGARIDYESGTIFGRNVLGEIMMDCVDCVDWQLVESG